jgi:hypothetical protein
MDPSITAHPTQLAFATACADVHRTDSVALGVTGAARYGVAYLVRPDWAVTAATVVRGLYPGQSVRLRFSGGEHRARLARVDVEADCALLRLEPPLDDQIPLSLLSGPVQPGTPWQTWVAAPMLGSPGHAVQGLVHESMGEDPQRGPALLLKTISGTSWWQPGLAGSPVLYGGRVIGHLRQLLGDAQSQSLCACPVTLVQSLLLLPGDATFLQPPKARYTRSFYVARPAAESDALSRLHRAGQPLVLWAPERHGKTWFLEHICQELIDQTTPYLLRLNLDRFSADAYVSLDSFVQEIASHLAAQFAVLPGARRDLMTQTLRVWRLTPQVERRLDAIIEQIFLQRTPGLLYLALDRLDAVKDAVFQDAFFAIIRGWMDRKDEPLWGRLRLLMATSMAPAWMAKLPTSSPFVITPPLVIEDFTVEQLQHLARLHDLPWDEDQLRSLMDLIGGHPYLTRMAMYTAVAKGYSVEQLVSPERPGVQVFDGFLETCRLRLIAQPGLWPTAERVLRGKPLSALDRLVLPRLERLGIVRMQGERCTVRYPLYLRLLEI